jgi:hypothetical protein
MPLFASSDVQFLLQVRKQSMAFREKEEDEDEEVSSLGQRPNMYLQPHCHSIALTSAIQVIMQQLQSGALRPSTASSSTLADDISSKV